MKRNGKTPTRAFGAMVGLVHHPGSTPRRSGCAAGDVAGLGTAGGTAGGAAGSAASATRAPKPPAAGVPRAGRAPR